MKETVKYGLILGLICFISSSLLAFVNDVTEEKIAGQKEKEMNLGLKEIMPQGDNFKPYLENQEIKYYSAYDNKDKLIGFVLKSAAKGYSSDVEVLTGLNLNLEIIKVKILSQNETPGLGNRITEAQFISQFAGKNLESFGQIQAITGATISSRTVIDSVKSKISQLKEELTKEIHHGR